MAERNKMTMNDRARQFLPFDAMKGLQEALRAKEYEMEAVSRGSVSPEQAAEISDSLANIDPSKTYLATYFENGHYLTAKGPAKLKEYESELDIGEVKIALRDLFGFKVAE